MPLALVLLVFASKSARAADADPAAQAYHRALGQYAAGDAAGALASMRESHRLSGRSELLYNIARLEDEVGDCAAALADYHQYLQRVPQGQYRAQAEQATTQLGARCPATSTQPPPVAPASVAVPDASTSAPAPLPPTAAVPAVAPNRATAPPAQPPAPAPRPNSVGNWPAWLGWSAIAAGGLAGVGALYFTVSAYDARARFRNSLQREVDGGPDADFGLQDEQHRDQRVAQVLAVTGGALLGGGVVLLALGARSPASAAVTAGVSFSPGGLSAQISSAF